MNNKQDKANNDMPENEMTKTAAAAAAASTLPNGRKKGRKKERNEMPKKRDDKRRCQLFPSFNPVPSLVRLPTFPYFYRPRYLLTVGSRYVRRYEPELANQIPPHTAF
jgi:hypothetical protein